MSDYCVIPLGKNGQYETKVSPQDYAALTKWRWNYKKGEMRRGGLVYARRGGGYDKASGGYRPTVLMHVYILETLMGIPRPSEIHTPDHSNRDALDNRRENLRWATPSEQGKNQNRGKRRAAPQAEQPEQQLAA